MYLTELHAAVDEMEPLFAATAIAIVCLLWSYSHPSPPLLLKHPPLEIPEAGSP